MDMLQRHEARGEAAKVQGLPIYDSLSFTASMTSEMAALAPS